MIPESQFERIQMSSANRRIAKAEMVAAEAMIDFWTDVAAQALAAFGVREHAPGRSVSRARSRAADTPH